MILLLCSLVVLAVFSGALLVLADDNLFCGVLGGVSAFIAFVGLIAYGVLVLDYIGAEHKARIMNREYGTDYTQEEVFYASSVIDTVRELDRKRLEVNGNILKSE